MIYRDQAHPQRWRRSVSFEALLMLADRMEAISRGGEPSSIARRTSDRLDALSSPGLNRAIQ